MRRATFLVSFAVLVWVAYRSASMGVTKAEAYSYNHFVSKPLPSILTLPYDPANQVLHSLLANRLLHLFRLTEVSFRLASLLGLVVYLYAASRFGLAGLILVLNPFTLFLLPESTGLWMACGLFLLAFNRLLSFQGKQDHLALASLLLGAAAGFQLSLSLPSLALIFLFLHFEFWGRRRIRFWQAIHLLLLPGTLLVFACWSLPLLKAVPSSPPTHWLRWAYLPGHFGRPPEVMLPKVARALRDDLRRNQPRPIRVVASKLLIEPFNFYRRRYALGAVEQVIPATESEVADYFILLPEQVYAAKSSTKIFAAAQISLFRANQP